MSVRVMVATADALGCVNAAKVILLARRAPTSSGDAGTLRVKARSVSGRLPNPSSAPPLFCGCRYKR
eukprot:scaffold2760_cov167-Amphora_coffeaeformis.AAC.7